MGGGGGGICKRERRLGTEGEISMWTISIALLRRKKSEKIKKIKNKFKILKSASI